MAQRKAGAYDGAQRSVLPVYASGQPSGNQVIQMDHPMRDLFLSNDSTTNNLTIVVTGEAGLSLTLVLLPGETINERFPEFLTVTVTAAGSWRWYVRSGRVI